MPVSTTRRAARHACASSMPRRSQASSNRPISSASRSLYRPQPSGYATPVRREPKRRKSGSSVSSLSIAIWKWWPGRGLVVCGRRQPMERPVLGLIGVDEVDAGRASRRAQAGSRTPAAPPSPGTARPRAPRTARRAGGRTSVGAAALALRDLIGRASSTISALAWRSSPDRRRARRASPQRPRSRARARSARSPRECARCCSSPYSCSASGVSSSVVEARISVAYSSSPSGSAQMPSLVARIRRVALERRPGGRRAPAAPSSRSPCECARATSSSSSGWASSSGDSSAGVSTARRVWSMTRSTTGAAAVRPAAMPSSRFARCAARYLGERIESIDAADRRAPGCPRAGSATDRRAGSAGRPSGPSPSK